MVSVPKQTLLERDIHRSKTRALVCIESQLKHEQVLVSLNPAACRLHSLSDVRLHMGHNTSMTLHEQAARGGVGDW